MDVFNYSSLLGRMIWASIVYWNNKKKNEQFWERIWKIIKNK